MIKLLWRKEIKYWCVTFVRDNDAECYQQILLSVIYFDDNLFDESLLKKNIIHVLFSIPYWQNWSSKKKNINKNLLWYSYKKNKHGKKKHSIEV